MTESPSVRDKHVKDCDDDDAIRRAKQDGRVTAQPLQIGKDCSAKAGSWTIKIRTS
jgi:hypothetical protein